MENTFVWKFDNWLCDRFQKIADFIQDVAGWTCFTCATICLVLYSFLRGFFIANTKEERIIAGIVGALVFFLWLRDIEKTKQEWESNPKFMNSVRPRWFILRAIVLLITFPYQIMNFIATQTSGDLYLVFERILFLSFLYFTACTPRPWNKDRVSKWIEGLSHKLFGKLVPQGT